MKLPRVIEKVEVRTLLMLGGAIFVWFVTPGFSYAAYYHFPEYSSYEATETIDKPELRHFYYGNLQNFPHTYEFALQSSSTVPVSLWVPDLPHVKTDLNAIVVKKMNNGSVIEVTRLNSGQGTWQSWRERAGNDIYRIGPEYDGELGPGSYILEVNSPTNAGKYVLAIGTNTSHSIGDWWRIFARVYAVKRFFGKSFLAVLTAPVVIVPAVVMGMVVVVGFRWRGRRRSTTVNSPHDAR